MPDIQMTLNQVIEKIVKPIRNTTVTIADRYLFEYGLLICAEGISLVHSSQ